MRKYCKLAVIILLVVLAMNLSCGKQDESRLPETGPSDPAKASVTASDKEITIFHLCVPASIKESIQSIVFTDVFNILKEKYGPDQERFTVRIHSEEGWGIPELLDKASKKEMDIFIGPMTYTKKIQTRLDIAGLRHKKLSATSAEIIVWDPLMEKHRFFDVLSLKLAEEPALKKYNILTSEDPSHYEKESHLRIYAVSTVVEQLKTIIQDVRGTLKSNKMNDIEGFVINERGRLLPDMIDIIIGGINKTDKDRLEKAGFRFQPIGNEALVIVTSKTASGPINISSSTLRDILTGKIDIWSKVSIGLDGEIIVYSHSLNFIQRSLKMDAPIKAVKTKIAEVINKASENNNVLGIICSEGASQAREKGLTFVSIDGMLPTNLELLKTGKYPYTAAYYIGYDSVLEADESSRGFLKEFIRVMNDEKTLEKLNVWK